jgi:hypothetical protein
VEVRAVTHATDKIKRPASQYYWGDWWKDKGLHSCSLTARGLWHEMNCLMHEGEPYGHLTLNGKPMTPQQLANQCRISTAQCTKLLQELENAGVFSKYPDLGTIISRRMVRDEQIRQARAEGGKAGAEHGAKGAESGKKGGRPKNGEGGLKTPLHVVDKPPPSSSSSSSPSVDEEANASSSPAKLPPCPHEAIVGLYHQVLPELPAVRLMPVRRKRLLDRIWRFVLTSKKKTDNTRRAHTADQALTWIGGYFERVRSNDFLMGRTPRGAGHENWQCDLDFLLSDRGMQHVIEKTIIEEQG